jgi:hypothetical protein
VPKSAHRHRSIGREHVNKALQERPAAIERQLPGLVVGRSFPRNQTSESDWTGSCVRPTLEGDVYAERSHGRSCPSDQRERPPNSPAGVRSSPRWRPRVPSIVRPPQKCHTRAGERREKIGGSSNGSHCARPQRSTLGRAPAIRQIVFDSQTLIVECKLREHDLNGD